MKSVTRTIQALVVIAMLCNFVVASDVESAFSKHEVVPDVLKVAPKQLLQVNILIRNYSKKIFEVSTCVVIFSGVICKWCYRKFGQ